MRGSIAIALVCFGAALAHGCGSNVDEAPAANDAEVEVADPGTARWQSSSQSGLYRIRIGPEKGAATLGPMHPWLVEVESREGEPVTAVHVLFDGGMPQHGHGFETSPRVVASPSRGVVRVDGVRFHTAGAWQIRVDVAGPAGADFAVFDVEIDP